MARKQYITHGFAMEGRPGSLYATRTPNPKGKKMKRKKGRKGAGRRRNPGADWKPVDDEKPLTFKEWLDAAQTFNPALKQFDAVLRNPAIMQQIEGNADVMKALAPKGPVFFRCKARLKGWAPPLTDEQHMAVIREIIEQLKNKK